MDPTLTPAQKRHARVKKWTKNVNLFEKDFVVVPINENAHWFLAIICFPGMDGTHTWDGKPIKIEVKSRKKSKWISFVEMLLNNTGCDCSYKELKYENFWLGLIEIKIWDSKSFPVISEFNHNFLILYVTLRVLFQI